MKLQNFLIGIGVFALFSILIFGFIDTSGTDCKGIYCENYLNITHDSNTSKAISNISTVGKTTEEDFTDMKENIRGTNASLTGELTEPKFFQSAWRVIKNMPKAYKPVANVLRMSETQFGVPPEFTTWVMSAIIIIVGLMIITAFLRNKLQS